MRAYSLSPEAIRDETRSVTRHSTAYFRDTVELATKIRCIFHWAEKAKVEETTRPNGRKDVVEWCSADEALGAQAEFFDVELGELAKRTMFAYQNLREQEWARRKERRVTVSLTMLFFVLLIVFDDQICAM